MAAKSRFWIMVLVVLVLSGCAISRTKLPVHIALLAPFEGRYREVGYNAYYAIRLAFADTDLNVEFLPIDDGGSTDSAVERARALALDPQVRLVLLMGYSAVSAETQQAFADVPLLIVGHWSAQPQQDDVFVLASSELDSLITAPMFIEVTDAVYVDTPIIGGEVFALSQFPMLQQSLADITIVSSASLPDTAFRERYLASAEFTPEPGLLATLAYDAAHIALQVVASSVSRSDTAQALTTVSYAGLNGEIRFENGYWANAPVLTYVYDQNRQLTPVDGIVEQR